MATYNVNRNVSDPFYRYKMPRLLAKVEGKGNGIKTVIPNMVDIAKALGRPPTYPTKYFGCELGAQVNWDKNDRYIVNGSHESIKLQSLLDGFIRKFVLCPSCDNPETVYHVQPEKGVISSRCKACGHDYFLDMTHRLSTFILKNPPDQPQGGSGSSLAPKTKGGRKSKKEGDPSKSTSSANGNEPNGQKEESVNGGAADEDEDDFDDDDWGDDISEDAIRKRQEDLSEGVKNLAVNTDLEKSEKERVDLLFGFIKDKHDKGTLVGADRDIVNEAERLEVRDKLGLILVEILLSEDILAQIKNHHKLFLRCCHENQKAQRSVLRGIEELLCRNDAQLLPKAALILKLLYDQDILEEEVILEWAKKLSGGKKAVKPVTQKIVKKIEPFIQWLQNAEEDSSSEDEEDDDDVELDFDDRVVTAGLKEEVVKVTPSPKHVATTNGIHGDDVEDDVDIDAI